MYVWKKRYETISTTLAGHTFQHDLRISAINGMPGSVDANQGDMLLGWDTDEFPCDIYVTTMAMYEILKAGGLNFDSKNRRPSYTHEDMFHAFILGMDADQGCQDHRGRPYIPSLSAKFIKYSFFK